MTNFDLRSFGRSFAGALLVVALAVGAAEATSVSGEAYGVAVDLDTTLIDKTPLVVLPPEGGSSSATVIGSNVTGAFSTGSLGVATSGTAALGTADSASSSTVQSVNILTGLITADTLTAVSTSTCDLVAASSDGSGSAVSNLVIAGVPIVAPAPNTVIPIPGVGTAFVNEQITGGNGVETSELTVNMLRVVLTGSVSGEIVVASAHSDVDCTLVALPTPTPTPTAPVVCPPPATPVPTPPDDLPIVSGEAFGVAVSGADVTVVEPTPHVVLPPEGGAASKTTLGINEPGTLSTGGLSVTTTGTRTATTADSESTASAQQIDAFAGLVTADGIEATSTSTCDGASASSVGSGAAFTNLTIAGTIVLGDISPPPNTIVPVPGVGTVILNEQIAGGDGVNTSELTVNMVHIILDPPLDGELVVASAHSDVDCAPTVIVPASNTTVSGEAFGLSVDVPPVDVDETPHVVLPPTGGMLQSSILGVSEPGTLDAGLATVTTSGTPGDGTASSASASTIEQIDVLAGLITADALTAASNSACDKSSATSDDTGTQISNLIVAGVPIPALPPPNTVIPLPGVGSVIVNEQIPGGDGIDTSELTVNLLHVVVTLPVPGDIVLASAHSDVDCAMGPAPTPSPTPTATPVCPVATPTPRPPVPLNEFLCYETRRSGPKQVFPGITVSDQFGTRTFEARRDKRLCLPVDREDTDPTAPLDIDHITSYEAKRVTPRFKKVKDVEVTNAFGTIVVDLKRPDRIYVPSGKSLAGPPGYIPAIDHFQCFKVRGSKFLLSRVKTDDQFFEGMFIDVKKPFRLCVATDKNGEGIIDPSAHLLCYKAKLRKESRPLNRPLIIFTDNQLRAHAFTITGPRDLCLPSTIGP